MVRDEVLGYHVGPSDTGDLAYRATFPKERVEALDESLIEPSLRCWLGPYQHAVLYPVRGGATYNLVLVFVNFLTVIRSYVALWLTDSQVS